VNHVIPTESDVQKLTVHASSETCFRHFGLSLSSQDLPPLTLLSKRRPRITSGEISDATPVISRHSSIVPFLSAAKMAKTLLSDDRENLFLWANYASLISSQKGKAAEARQVYITCLSADRMADDSHALVELFADWAEMEWMQGNDRASLAVTVAAFSTEIGDLSRCEEESLQQKVIFMIFASTAPFLETDGPPSPSAPAILRARRVSDCGVAKKSCPCCNSRGIVRRLHWKYLENCLFLN
jgi:hypothetical protein